MTTAYAFPRLTEPPQAAANSVYLVACGDLRRSANVKGWPVQQKLEADLARALGSLGWSVVRAHDYDEQAGHRRRLRRGLHGHVQRGHR